MYHLIRRKVTRNNLFEADKPSIACFAKQDDLILTKVDKGIAKTILEVEYYLKKTQKLLSNNSLY